jgi:hypothetical protein
VGLNDPKVSKEHCEFTWSSAGLRVRDLGNMNGVIVHGMGVYNAVGDQEVRDRSKWEHGAEVRERRGAGDWQARRVSQVASGSWATVPRVNKRVDSRNRDVYLNIDR